MKKLLILVLITLILIVTANQILPIHGEEKIYDSVVRLHVLANSDSEEDQALKLKVRDRVLEISQPILSECTDKESAEKLLEGSLEQIKQAARQVVLEQGYDYSVSVILCEEDYPERSYDGFCFPGGKYMSLRVCLGEAEGKNWWCVVFPPLCMSAASVTKQQAEDAFISVGLTPEQYKIVTESQSTPKYKIRFKFLETLQSIFG